jgi:hypothetical protein
MEREMWTKAKLSSRYRWSAFILALSGTFIMVASQSKGPAFTTAAAAPVMYGEWNPTWQTSSGGVNNQVITSRETAMAHPMNLIHWYADGSVSNNAYVGEGYADYDNIMVNSALSLGRTPLVSWSVPIGFENVAGNTTVLDDWANGMKATGKTIMIRLFWEFNDPSGGNGDFYVCKTSHTPASLVTTWRYIVNRFRTDGATNVKWVWNPDGTMGSQMYGSQCGSVGTAYPGDSYVDYRGFDTYDYNNQAQYNAENTQTGSALPMIIGEFGTTDSAGGSPWLNDLSTRINDGAMAQVAAVVWFNDQSWVINSPSNPTTDAALKAMLQTTAFQSGSSSAPTPTPAPTQSPTSTPTATPTTAPTSPATATPTITPTSTATSTPAATSTPTPTTTPPATPAGGIAIYDDSLSKS